jgi:hypothetical protein
MDFPIKMTANFVPGGGAFDGDWYSPFWRYAFRIFGTRGTTLVSNSPNYSVGQEMLRIFGVTGNTFTGQQIFTDGLFHPVSGTLVHPDTIRMSTTELVFGDNPWNMVRCQTPAPRVFAASVNLSFSSLGGPSDLYRVGLGGCAGDTRIGRVRTITGAEPVLFDVALTQSGILYGVSQENEIFRVDTATAIATSVGRVRSGCRPGRPTLCRNEP